jgi:hypothetical protein
MVVLEEYFSLYPAAIDALSEQFESTRTERLGEFRRRLRACPTGKAHFDEYQKLGTEIWSYIFADKLGAPRVERGTADGVQRRDTLFRNLRKSSFFDRVFSRFGADFVIVDFKNYKDELDSDVIESVSNYANEALGNFVIAVSRKGGGSAARKGQLRVFKKKVLVLAVSDEQMLEMVARKERGEEPEDELEDLLNELLIKY